MKQDAAIPRRGLRRAAQRTAAIVGVIAILGAGGLYWWHGRATAPSAARAPAPVPVTVAAAANRDVPILLEALGTVQAANTIAVPSQIAGKPPSVEVQEGQPVHNGDTLAAHH